MQHVIISVYDRAVEAHVSISSVPSIGVAIRGFTDEVNNPRDGNNLNKHPQDFDLYEIARVDDQTGGADPTGPILLIRGIDAVNKSK